MPKIPKFSLKNTQKSTEKQPSPLFLALLLTGILALEMPSTLITTAIANAGVLKSSPSQSANQNSSTEPEFYEPLVVPKPSNSKQFHVELTSVRGMQGYQPGLSLASPALLTQGNSRITLPPQVAQAVRQAVSRDQKIAAGQLKVSEFSRQSWPNSCLGLAKSGEVCGQMIVQGWRVAVTDGRQTWVYRTDATGRVVRREEAQNTTTLPSAVANAVLREATSQSGLPAARLRIVQAKRQTWPDGCLGLGGPETACLFATVPGWEVTVQGGVKRWVYRTDESGSVVHLDRNGGSSADAGSLKAEKIPAAELPTPITRGMVFRAISSGGITGRTYETVLMEDGRLMRVLMGPENDNDSGRQVFQVSRQQVQQFQQLLKRVSWERYNQLSYPAMNGAADYITVTLSSAAGTTRYADVIQNQLPQPLQDVIQAWSQITRVIQ